MYQKKIESNKFLKSTKKMKERNRIDVIGTLEAIFYEYVQFEFLKNF